MKHGVKFNRLNRNASHRKALLSNLATSVLRQGLKENQMERSVRTTIAKAKSVKRVVERLVTYAKKGDLSARREAARVIHDHEVLQGLFETIGPRYAERQGGYTRVLKLDLDRAGDNAEMAIICLVEDKVEKRTSKPKASKPKADKVDITEAAKKA
ncbi:MAG TPA: 50S ribosomal protein L17 [Fibrobacteria bacterium]|nr:50S ribosomal protein L17 [Fibrobacteria bacterium]